MRPLAMSMCSTSMLHSSDARTPVSSSSSTMADSRMSAPRSNRRNWAGVMAVLMNVGLRGIFGMGDAAM